MLLEALSTPFASFLKNQSKHKILDIFVSFEDSGDRFDPCLAHMS